MADMFSGSYRNLFGGSATPTSGIPTFGAGGGPVNTTSAAWLPAAITTLGSLLGVGIGARSQSSASRMASQDAARAAEANRQMQMDILAQQERMEAERRRLEAEQFAVAQANIAAQMAEQARQWQAGYGLQREEMDYRMAQDERRRQTAAPYRAQVEAYLKSGGPSIITRPS